MRRPFIVADVTTDPKAWVPSHPNPVPTGFLVPDQNKPPAHPLFRTRNPALADLPPGMEPVSKLVLALPTDQPCSLAEA